MSQKDQFFDHRALPVFVSDALLPSQMVNTVPLKSEQRLIFAVMEDAFNLLWKNHRMVGLRASRMFKETHDWVQSDETYPFSFVFCCEVLGLKPESIRWGIKKRLESLALGEPALTPLRRSTTRMMKKIGSR